MASPYAGVRILDFTQGIGGPMGCALMADFGADVVKVESSEGDWAKDMPHYVVWNRNKRRITLDLTKPSDRQEALELIAKADIVVFDKHPGELEKIGLDAETLRKDHPELIHVWAPPYGTTGEWSDLPPDHMLLTALFGSAFRQASYAEQPVFLVTPLGFYGHGILLCSAMCTALFERARSGEGQAVIAAGLQGLQIFQNPAAGSDGATVPARQPLGTSVSYRVYECSDGKFLALGALFPHFFTRTLETLGFEDPASIPRAPESAPLLMKRFRERPRDEWIELFLKHDVPAAPVITRQEWFHSSIVASNNMRLTLDHPAHGKVTMPGTPVNFSTFEAGVRHLMRDAQVSDIDWAARQPTARNAKAPVDKGPLAGITILDLGTVIAGAYSTGILTGLGANVIKIEPEEGDPFRSMGAVWASYHRGKRGLGLDLKDPSGRELFLELVKKADVVLDNYRFGVRKRLGIDYEVLKEVNPNIISCTINAYGANNEFTQTPGFDVVIQGHSGIMMAQGGEPDGEPIMNSMVINDVGSAAISSMGVLAALFARETTGRGMEVLTSMANVSLTVQAGEMAEYANRRPNIPGGRDLLGDEPLHHFYKCKDGRWVAVSAATEERFAALAKALDRADLTKTYAGRALGADRDGPLTKDLMAIFAAISADEALAKLRAAGVPCAPTLRGPETFGDPYLWENDVFDNYFSPRHGDAFTGTPCLVHWGRSRSRNYDRPSPDIGEHTEEVLREFGIDESRMADLAARRIIFSTT